MSLEAVLSSAKITGDVHVTTLANDYQILEVSTPQASAKIAFQGATLFEWQPLDEKPVIFTSSQAIFSHDKAIRGGIPICWPWFANHPTDETKPSHGFARNTPWELASIHQEGDDVLVQFKLPFHTHPTFPHTFELNCLFRIGKSLSVSLTSTNKGLDTFEVGGALHTYFDIANIHETSVSGLENVTYLDKFDNNNAKLQSNEISISEPVDRVYENTTSLCLIQDKGNQRVIEVEKENSTETVVWNPWEANAKTMADLGDEDYLRFVCVEAVNASNNFITLAPGESHTLTQKMSVL